MITPALRLQTEQRLRAFAEKHYAGRYVKLDVRFRGQFCYVDVFQEPAVPNVMPSGSPETKEQRRERLLKTPLHLCRLRYGGPTDTWGIALFLYSSEKYEETILPTGEWEGTLEEVFELAADFHLTEG